MSKDQIMKEVAAAVAQIVMDVLFKSVIELFGRDPHQCEINEFIKNRWGDRVWAKSTHNEIENGVMTIMEMGVDYDNIPADVIQMVKDKRAANTAATVVPPSMDDFQIEQIWFGRNKEGDNDEAGIDSTD